MPSKRHTASKSLNSLNGYTLLGQRVKRHFFGAPDSVGLNRYTLGFFFEKVKGVKGQFFGAPDSVGLDGYTLLVSQIQERKSLQQSTLCKKATNHQVTTMLATSKNVLFPSHNHLLPTSADDPTLLIIAREPAR